jgi:hypothetical protein
MLWRYGGEPRPAAGAAFPDADGISDWARDAVNWAVENGIVSGYPDGTFGSQKPATRAEVAQMLARWTEL